MLATDMNRALSMVVEILLVKMLVVEIVFVTRSVLNVRRPEAALSVRI